MIKTKDAQNMDESLLTEEYLSKFPTILCEALKSSDKYRNRFLKRVKKEYSPIKVYRGIHKLPVYFK